MLASTTGGPVGQGRRLYFEAGGRILSAEICDPALFEQARRLFPFYEVQPPRSGFSVTPDVCVDRESNTDVVAKRGESPVAYGTVAETLAALEFSLTRAILASLGKYIHLHASGAVVNGQAVLALGRSGAGKSSLAISWLSLGYRTLGDDIVFLNSSAKALPFKRLFKAAPASLEPLGIDPATTFLWDPEWPEVWYAPDKGFGWAEEAPVAVIAVVRHDPNASLALTPVSKTEALNTLLHSTMDTGVRPRDCFDTLARLVDGARVLNVEYPSACEAAEALSVLTT